jgi:hypothetical protein
LELQEAGITFTAKVSMTEKDFINESELEDLFSDLVLSDYDLPKYTGALSFIEARRRCPDPGYPQSCGTMAGKDKTAAKSLRPDNLGIRRLRSPASNTR